MTNRVGRCRVQMHAARENVHAATSPDRVARRLEPEYDDTTSCCEDCCRDWDPCRDWEECTQEVRGGLAIGCSVGSCAALLVYLLWSAEVYEQYMWEGACPFASPHAKACAACRGVLGNKCTSSYGWDWRKTVAENERKISFPGMQILRGMEGARASGVQSYATWNQSNWPSLVQSSPTRVRAASPADRLRLCKLWQREHSYQSFPVLLGCPGRRATEYEPTCTSQMAVVRIPCAAIDLTSAPTHDYAGAIFDERRWWRVSHCTRPPKLCDMPRAARVVRLKAVGVAMSIHPTAVGHFVPEQYPKLLLLHHLLPPEVPILLGDSGAVRRYMQPLVDAGVIPQSRLLYRKLKANDGTLVRADSLYTVLSSHFSNIMSGDAAYLTARSLLEQVPPHPTTSFAKRTHILVVDRKGAQTRRLTNHNDVLASLRRAATSALAADTHIEAIRTSSLVRDGRPVGQRRAFEGQRRALEVRSWQPAPNGNMSADIAAWRGAAIVVAPHGAGLANMLFASAGTPIIEVCYDDFGNANAKGMACPAMYGAMAVNLHLPYWVVTGKGSYSKDIEANLTQLTAAAAQALRVVYDNWDGPAGAPDAPDARGNAHDDEDQIVITQNKAALSPAELALLEAAPGNSTEMAAACSSSERDAVCRFLSLRASADADGSIATTVWTGGVTLAKFLQLNFPGSAGLDGWTCLELGAGTGVAGIMAAMLGARVVLTDLAAALPYLRLNAATNLSAEELRRTAAAELRWGTEVCKHPLLHSSRGQHGGFFADLLLCGDILYSPGLVPPLCQTVLASCGPHTIVLCLAVLRPGVGVTAHYLFLSTLEQEGLHLRRVHLDERDRFLVVASRAPLPPHDRRPSDYHSCVPRLSKRHAARRLPPSVELADFDTETFIDSLGPGPMYRVGVNDCL